LFLSLWQGPCTQTAEMNNEHVITYSLEHVEWIL
jgi:hypothetical protein